MTIARQTHAILSEREPAERRSGSVTGPAISFSCSGSGSGLRRGLPSPTVSATCRPIWSLLLPMVCCQVVR